MSDNQPPDRYQHVMRAFSREIWAIQESKYRAMCEVLKLRLSGGHVDADTIQAVMAAAPKPTPRSGGSIAVLPLFGVIAQRMDLMTSMSGGTSTESYGRAFQQAMGDPNVTAIVMEVDSPGGSVSGVMELGDLIFNARGTKPIVAVASSLAASAAYWIASQADELVVTPSGEVGSIGVLAYLEDWSQWYAEQGIAPEIIRYGEHKAEVNDFEPLSKDSRAYLQKSVDQFGESFVKAVAKGRGVSASTVRSSFGQGRTVQAKDAVAVGMADRVDTLDGTLARLASGRWKAPVRQAAEEITVRMVAVDEALAAKKAEDEPLRLSMEAEPEPVTEPQPEPAPPAPADMAAEDGYTEWAAAVVGEWEQSDAETITRG